MTDLYCTSDSDVSAVTPLRNPPPATSDLSFNVNSLHHERTTMQTETMNVTGMTCGGCVSKVTQALTALPGVAHVAVSLPASARVDFDEKLISRERLQSAVEVAGFGVAVGDDAPASRSKGGCCG